MPIAISHSMINCQSSRPAVAARAVAAAGSIGRLLRLWRARIRERQAFPVLDERDLRDFGVSRWELERELSKPFWRD
jgi:uncharacterized protein YjiS (DUF1127 family)